MKKLLVLAILLLPVVAVAEGLVSGTCEQCPKGAGCTVRIPADCGNYSTAEAWCKDGQWFRGEAYSTTLAACIREPKYYSLTPDGKIGR